MQRAISDLTLELSRSCDGAAVTVKRGDTHRRLRIRLTQAGRPYPVDAGCSAVFTAVKPDGSHLFNACTVTDGAIYYDLTPQTTALPGELACEIRLYGENEALLTSAAFLLTVADTVYRDGDESVASSGEATELTRLINEADRKISELEAVLANEVNHAIIDDSTLGTDAWSSKNIVDKLCPDFSQRGAVVGCAPVEGYPLEVVSTLEPRDSHQNITLYHCGKNLFNVDRTYVSVNNGRATVENGVLTVYGQMVNSGRMPIKPNTKYTVSFKSTRTGTRGGGVYGVVYNASNESTIVINNLANTTNVTYTFTTPADAVELNLSFYGSNDNTDSANYSVFSEIQLEVGNTATAYAPYKGQVFTADLTNAPLLIAGASYNWNTGLLYTGESEYWHDPATGNFYEVAETDAVIHRKITAFSGENIFFSDCGDTEVKGKADPVKIIEKLTNAILAQGGTV